jgi:hypothetical protein
MIVNVVEIGSLWAIVQYEEAGFIQRKSIPRSLLSMSSKGEARLPKQVVNASPDYSDVDLIAGLGKELPPIRVDVLQDALRRVGVWTRQDYRTKPQVVAGVIARLRGLDVATVSNAALTVREDVHDDTKS